MKTQTTDKETAKKSPSPDTQESGKHTSGPWSIDSNDACCVIGENSIVCTTDFENVTDEEAGANAKLIASAPAMLEACEASRKFQDFVTGKIFGVGLMDFAAQEEYHALANDLNSKLSKVFSNP